MSARPSRSEQNGGGRKRTFTPLELRHFRIGAHSGARQRRGASSKSACRVGLNPSTYRALPIALRRLAMRSA